MNKILKTILTVGLWIIPFIALIFIVLILMSSPLPGQTDYKDFYEETLYNQTIQSAYDNGTINGVLFERSRVLGETNDCGSSLVALNETLGRYVNAVGCE